MVVAFPVIHFGAIAVSATKQFALPATAPTNPMELNALSAKMSGRAASVAQLQGALLVTPPLH